MGDDLLQPLRDLRVYLRWLERTGMTPPRAESRTEADAPRRPATTPPPAGDRRRPPPAPPAPAPPPHTPPDNEAPMTYTPVPFPPDDPKGRALLDMAAEVAACRACPLGEKRTNTVFGVGSPDADLVFIGEAPGANEDRTGMPFVGAAGNLLTQELGRNGITRDEVFICNIVKCRPPNNRDPEAGEIAACTPFLHRQLGVLKPRLLCALGRLAAGHLLGAPIRIMKQHGTWERYAGLPLFICLHPAAVLHQGGNRELFVRDIETLAKAYHALGRG